MASNDDPTASLFLNMLLEMGFTQDLSERALRETYYGSVQRAVEWLMNHQTATSPSGDEPETLPRGELEPPEHMEIPARETEPQAGCSKDPPFQSVASDSGDTNISVMGESLLCEECNEVFRIGSDLDHHAVSTGHSLFAEIEDQSQPLTKEEKKEQIKKCEALIKQRRAEKEEQQKREEIEREKNRRKHGQEMSEARQRLEEQEMKHLAKMKRKEKQEARLARQKVLEDIERDKQARKERFSDIGPVASTSNVRPTIVHVAGPPPPEPDKEYDVCRLQIRLTNGECLRHTFSPNEELAAVRLYIELNRTDGQGPFTMMTLFPKKIFTEEDMSYPLKALGLVPSAVIMVGKTQ